MLFSVVDTSEMKPRNVNIPWNAYLSVKRGLRNASFTNKRKKFNPKSQNQPAFTRFQVSTIQQETNQKTKEISPWATTDRLTTTQESSNFYGEKQNFGSYFESQSENSSGSGSKSVNLSQGNYQARNDMRQAIMMKSRGRENLAESRGFKYQQDFGSDVTTL